MNRAPLFQALLSLLSRDMLHAAKRVKSLEQTDSSVTVAFEDGTDAHFNAVIGADGIFGSVRNCDKGSKSRAWNIRFRIQSNNSLRVSRSIVLPSCFCEGGRPAIYAHSVQPGI